MRTFQKKPLHFLKIVMIVSELNFIKDIDNIFLNYIFIMETVNFGGDNP